MNQVCITFVALTITEISSQETLFQPVGSINHTNDSGAFFWNYANHSGNIFLKLEENNLVDITTGKCIAEILPTGTRTGEETTEMYQSMQLTSTAIVTGMNSGFLSQLTNYFVGERILYVLGATLLFIILFVLLVAVIIMKNSKIRNLKMAMKNSQIASDLDNEHFILTTPPCATTSFHSDSNEASESRVDDDIYHREDSSSENKQSRPVKNKSKGASCAYEDVTLPNGSIAATHQEIPHDTSKEDTPILEQVANAEDEDTYNVIDHTKLHGIPPAEDFLPPPPPDPSMFDETGQSSLNDEGDRVYDTLNDQHRDLSRQVTVNSLHQQFDSEPSSDMYDCLGQPDGAADHNALNRSTQKSDEMYEDISNIRIQGDTNGGNYTHLQFNKPNTAKCPEDDLYDTVDRP